MTGGIGKAARLTLTIRSDDQEVILNIEPIRGDGMKNGMIRDFIKPVQPLPSPQFSCLTVN